MDPKEAINRLNKVFCRLDACCQDNNVYKICTVGSRYVIMGYNGRPDKNKRTRGHAIEECFKVINTGIEIINVLEEFSLDNHVQIGVHTG